MIDREQKDPHEQEEAEGTARASWDPPELVELGTIEEMTEGTPGGAGDITLQSLP